MEGKIKSFKDLKVWQKGIELVSEIYKITKGFPEEERYGLTSQLKRASISVPSNIAEGFRRNSVKGHKQFLNIALGSCAELETQIIIAKELGYINSISSTPLMDLIDHICGMLVNLDKRINA